MNTILRLASILVLTVGCSSQPSLEMDKNPSSTKLSEYSTQEIVEEYNSRLDQILNVTLSQIEERGSLLGINIDQNMESNSESQKDSRELQRDLAEQYFNATKALTHFAEGGDLRAQEVMGPAAVYSAFRRSIETGFRINDKEACEGILYTLSAAKRGSTEAVGTMPGLYMMLRGPLVLRTDAEAMTQKRSYAQQMLYWLWELNRSTGSDPTATSNFFFEFDAEEIEQLKQDWIKWSPATSFTDDVLQALCPSSMQ